MTLRSEPAASRSRPPVAARRAGYVVALVVNALMLLAVNRWPGWESASFLTSDTREVLGVVNASIAATLVANLVYLRVDPAWLRDLGEAITTSVGVVAMVRIWQVFPLDADGGAELLARVVLGLGIAGSAAAVLVALVRFARSSDYPARVPPA